MDFVDRHRRGQCVDAVGRRSRPRQMRLVEHDGSGLRPHLACKGHRIGLQRKQMAMRSDNFELVVVAGLGVRDEQLPIARAAHPHRMAPPVPEVEVADHGDTPGVGRQHHEADAIDAFEPHRMRAELVVKALVGAFAEQIEIEIGQDRRKAIGVLEFDDVVAELRAELVVLRAVRKSADEQAGSMDAIELRHLAVLAHRFDVGRIGKKCAHHALVALGMQPEIVERIGVATLDDRIGLGREFRHGLRSRYWTECEAVRTAAHGAPQAGGTARTLLP